MSVHKLRSSFAMEFYKSEHDILVLQNHMGHASIAATNIYARASDKEDAVNKPRNWRQK
ncbi:tyrosine-type recombinase/integrase [Pseudobutyrivibrio ruminis]|uniref:tyrosine-type recombinase/integrase n=1 Tax=Pseudobutyrivibrio ruminis TaxID=46206 RepID=UPI002350E0BC|nr:tyrosine-type recombinase/integrase [Pseudobutyrivibrio ruminis]